MRFFLVLVLAACVHKDKLHPFPLQQDPTGIAVWGLAFNAPTERVHKLTPILEVSEAVGGLTFDARNRVLFASDGEGVYSARKVADDSVIWRREHPDPLSMPPLFVARESIRGKQDLVIFGSQNGKIIAVSADKGEAVWVYDLGGELRTKPSLAQGRLLVTNARNQLVALDALTGKWLWQYTRDFPVTMTILGHSGITVKGSTAYVGFSDGFVCGVNIEDGLLVWSRPLTLSSQGFSDVDTTPALSGDRLFAASIHDGVHALRASNGEVLWQLRVPNVTRLAVHEPYLFAVSTNGLVYGVDTENGRVVWQFRMPAAEITQPVVHGGYVTVGAKPGGLFVLEQSTGRLVQRFFPGGISSELAYKDNLLAFLSEGNFIYLLRFGDRSGVLFNGRRRFVGL